MSSDWHGWSSAADPRALHVGRLPGRKSVCLYVADGSTIRTLAFFKTVGQAREALELLDALAGLRPSALGEDA